MSEFLLRLYSVLLLSVVYVTAEETGHSVLVSFAQNVAFENGKALIDGVKESLQGASKVLHGAIGHQFSKVTFQIPYSWSTSDWNVTVEKSYKHDRQKADMLIDSTNDVVFGKFPFARQYGSCGTPGHQIIIPAAFFDEANTFPRSISLAREWLKYRYGVFDENGYLGDTQYPSFYTIPGRDRNEVQITDCTDSELAYKFVDSNNNATDCSTEEKPLTERLEKGECKIDVDENSLENVTSSLMYYEEKFLNMQHVCGKDGHKHNSRSPNKQNVLCNGKSIWESIMASTNYQAGVPNEEFTEIEYVYVQEPTPKVIVAWEDTEKLLNNKLAILYAVNKFMIDLPHGSMFSAFPFTDEISEEHPLEELNSLADKKNVPKIGSDFQEKGDGNVNLAISKAIEISGIKDSESAADIIIITGSQGDSSDSNLIEKIKDLQKVCIKILFLSDGEIPDEVKDYNNKFPCATVEKFPMSDSMEELFEKLYESMEKILPLTTGDKATETVKTQQLSYNSSITHEADGFTETVTFWMFTDSKKTSFKLTFNGEEQQSESINSDDIKNVLFISYSIKQAGTITLSSRYERLPSVFVQVRRTSAERKYFSGEVVVHNPSQGSGVQMPVIIYAIVRFGPYPLQNAKVSAVIKDPTGYEHPELDLFDDGRGDPDITQNDGIYSRYFTDFSEEGIYTVTVHVRNNENLATYGADENAGYHTCCGSFVKKGTSTELGDFSKSYHGTFKAVSSRPIDGYKPSRITDLRIDGVTDDKIILKWSAPGGEADSGKALSYEIKFFNSQEDAMANFDSANGFNYTETPKERGNTETFEISFKEFGESGEYYIAVKAKNENKTSDISNTVTVFVPEDKVTDDKDEEKKDENVKTGGLNRRTITIVIGIIVAVVVLAIIVYLLIYFIIVKPKIKKGKKKKAENQSNGSGPKVENSTLNPVNFVSADTLIRHHNEKTKAKMENKEPPILKEEDFEGKSPSPANETEPENSDQQPERSNKISSNGVPPKSPKRTTYV